MFIETRNRNMENVVTVLIGALDSPTKSFQWPFKFWKRRWGYSGIQWGYSGDTVGIQWDTVGIHWDTVGYSGDTVTYDYRSFV